MKARALAVVFFLLALPAIAQVPTADFAWTPESPQVNELVTIQDFSSNATSTTFFVENSHPQPGNDAKLAFNVAGVYQLKMVATNASGSDQKIRYINVGVAASPRMSASPTTVKVGELVQFSDTSSGFIHERLWSFGDGAVSSQMNPSHSYAEAGSYQAKLEVQYSSGRQSTSKTITVQPAVTPPQITPDFTYKPAFPRVGQTVTFTDASTGPVTSWSWDFAGETAGSRSAEHIFVRPGKYDIKLTATGNGASGSVTKVVKVLANGSGNDASDLPPLVPAFDTFPSCLLALTGPVQFIDKSLGAITDWQWTFGDGARSAMPSPPHVYAEAGKKSVTLTVSDGVNMKSITRVLDIPPNPELLPLASFSSLCCGAQGYPVEFFNTSQKALTYVWDFGDGTTSTAVHPSHRFAQKGDYIVTLTAINKDGENQLGRSMHILSNDPPISDFTVQPETMAVGQTASLAPTLTDAVRFHWTITGGGTTVEKRTRSLQWSPPSAGTYSITLETTNTWGVSSKTVKDQLVQSDVALVANFTCAFNGYKTVKRSSLGECHPKPPLSDTCTFDDRGIDGVCLWSCDALEEQYTCSDHSTGSPDTFLWGSDYYFDATAPAATGRTVTLLGSGFTHTVIRQIDGARSSAYKAYYQGQLNYGSSSVKANFTWSPITPHVGEVVTFTDTSSGLGRTANWRLDGVLASGTKVTRTFGTAGPREIELEVSNGSDHDNLTQPITVVSDDSKPKITDITTPLGDCFFSIPSLDAQIKAKVDWKGKPGTVTYSINGGPEQAATFDANDNVQFSLNASQLLKGGSVERSEIRMTPINGDNVEGSPISTDLYLFDTSPPLGASVKFTQEANKWTLKHILKMPDPAWKGIVTVPTAVPMLGGKEFGLVDTQGTLTESFSTDCKSSIEGKGATGFKLGGVTLGGSLSLKQAVSMSKSSGIATDTGTLGLEVSGKVEQTPTPVLEAIPQLAVICDFPVASTVCGLVKVKGELSLAAGANVSFKTDSNGISLFDTTMPFTNEVKITALLDTGSKDVGFEMWGGGSQTITFGVPAAPFFRDYKVELEAGAKLKVYLFSLEKKIGVSCVTAGGGTFKCDTTGLSVTPSLASASGPARLVPLPVFDAANARYAKQQPKPDTVVIDTLSPLAAPAVALSGTTEVVVYVEENAKATNLLQRTDLHFVVRRDGTWSAPKALTADNLADLAPSLTATSDGRYVAVWQHIKNAALTLDDIKTQADLPKINREVEIVASVYSPNADIWSEPLALTDNAVYDHDATVVALSDGKVIALWLRDPGNDLGGTTANPTQIVARILSGGTWGAESMIASGLTGVQGFSAAARGTSATVVYSHDKDGNEKTLNDREIATISYTGGSWAAAHDLTADSVSDVAPHVVYTTDTPRVLWISDGDLVWQAIGGSRSVVRAKDGGNLILNAIPATSASGQVVVVWTEESGGNVDVIARTFDPTSGLWSDDAALTRTEAVESNLTPFFASDGKLGVAGLETAVQFDGAVAAPGRVDLFQIEKTLITDVGIDPSSLSTSVETPANGDTITLIATMLNSGDLPVHDVPVTLYAGRGTKGAVLGAGKISGDWRGGEKKAFQITYTYSTAAQEVTLSVDQTGDTNSANNTAIFSYANAPPHACAQVDRMNGGAPFTVTFDGRCSVDSDGTIARTRWTFPDGTSADGALLTHTFTSQGTYPVTMTVTDDLGKTSNTVVTIHVGTLPDIRSKQANSVVIPAVARTAGASGTFFVSDASILNVDEGTDLVVDAMFMPDGRSDFHYERLRIPPGHIASLSDLLAETFHASGAGWARFDLSHPHAVVTSRSYNKQPAGTAGTFIPGVRSTDAVTDGSKRVFLQAVLPGYRVNFGMTEISGDGSNVTVTAYDASGKLLGVKQYELEPYAHVQIGGEPLYQNPGRIEVTVDSGQTVAYLTTVDNKTGDAVYQEGVEATRVEAGVRTLVALVGHLRGSKNTTWRSDVRLFNAETVAQSVRMTLTTSDRTLDKTVLLAAGETKAYDDVIAALYPEITGDTLGTFSVQADGRIIVTSRTFNLTPDGTYGLSIAGKPVNQLLAAGDVGDIIQIENDADYRCNFGATAAEDSTILLRAYDGDGKLLGEKTFGIAANHNLQVGIFSLLGVTQPLPAARLQVTVLAGRVYAYGTVTDNRTGDGIFVEAARS